MSILIGRRRILSGASAALCLGALPRCAANFGNSMNLGPRLELAPVDTAANRIVRITVCTRPFRPQGPRLDVEQIAGKTVVHNYGHGGSGWSLSWGSSGIAADKAMATGERDIAVIGCGALGMTSALSLQRAGANVIIYAKDLPPNVRSSFATGLFTPDSRICFEQYATPEFKSLWEGMCRRAYQTYYTLLGLPGNPVEYIDSYNIADDLAGLQPRTHNPNDTRPQFAELQRELTPDLITGGPTYNPGSHPFGNRYVRKSTNLMFNLVEYSQYLLSEFHANGGKIEITEFHSPSDFARLPQGTLINCTGYGARALLGDNSLIPVRGQLARTIPQPEVHYGLSYNFNSFVARRDGFLFQHGGNDEYQGFNDERIEPDRAEAETAVNTIAQLFRGRVGY